MSNINWIDIKLKLEKENKSYGRVLSDLDSLEEWAEKLIKKLSSTLPAISDEMYLQVTAIHVLVISQLEYLLKSLGILEKRGGIRKIIKESKPLTQLEKDHLMYLFLTRHTIMHNGGHYDEEFFKDIKKEIKELKINIPNNNSLSPRPPDDMAKIYIKLIRKIILLDIAKDILSREEIKIVEAIK